MMALSLICYGFWTELSAMGQAETKACDVRNGLEWWAWLWALSAMGPAKPVMSEMD